MLQGGKKRKRQPTPTEATAAVIVGDIASSDGSVDVMCDVLQGGKKRKRQPTPTEATAAVIRDAAREGDAVRALASYDAAVAAGVTMRADSYSRCGTKGFRQPRLSL